MSVEHLIKPEAGGTVQQAAARRTRRVLVLSSSFPSSVEPVYGVFVKERVRFVSQRPGVQVRVVAPTPYFPPFKRFKRWYPFSQHARHETVDGLAVVRPRYFLPPKIGGYVHPYLMYPAARRAAGRLRREFDFDLIDSHFVYPNGVTAVMLGKLYQKPVVITCRGADILRFPRLPVIGGRIRYALQHATQLIAVSQEIADAMERQGADPAKISVIPNGVDGQKFRPLPMKQSRNDLELPLDRPMIVSAGYRLELKGFHILVDAIPRIREQIPDILLVIVGGQARWADDYLPAIEERIRANNVADHVILTGVRPQEELAKWYSAADVFALLTSREGSPNVLLEALACGVPAVATAVGGIPDVLCDSRLGLMLPERSAQAAAAGIVQALSQNWDREQIRALIENRSWENAAKQVDEVFERALAQHRTTPSD